VLQKVSSSRHLRKEGPTARSPLSAIIHAALYPSWQPITHELASWEKTARALVLMTERYLLDAF
jgi:hypothetical protein